MFGAMVDATYLTPSLQCDASRSSVFPEHKTTIDEWKQRTPMDGKEISFIKSSCDLILKKAAFPAAAGFRLAEFGPEGAMRLPRIQRSRRRLHHPRGSC